MLVTYVHSSSQVRPTAPGPHPFRCSNFVDFFRQSPIWRWSLNTLLYSVLATLGLLVSSVPVAYALSRLRWRGRDAVFLVVLVALMLPPQVSVIPVYVLWAKLHLVGTLWPLIIPSWLGTRSRSSCCGSSS